MSRFHTEPALAYTAQNRTAVLLLNLGTPDAPTATAVKPYLKEFLSDQRVVELPKLLWQPILRGLVRSEERRVGKEWRWRGGAER